MIVTISDNGEFQKMRKGLDSAIKMGVARATAGQELAIKTRTARGYGLKGKFSKYSDGYKAFRRKKGRKVSPVNLHFTGRMLASIQWTANKRRGKIFLSSSSEKKKAAWTHADRPWWGITQKEQSLINKQFNKGFRAKMR